MLISDWSSDVCSSDLAGVCEVTGPIGQLVPQVSPGYGYAAITVAFLGRLNPIGILFASLLMALLYIGGDSAQMSLNLPQVIHTEERRVGNRCASAGRSRW